MPRKLKTEGNLALANFDDIFQPTAAAQSTIPPELFKGGRFEEVPLSELHPPEFHPFHIRDDLDMQRLIKSVVKRGVLEPCLARPRSEGGYELIAGNRRKHACEVAGIDTLPVIIKDIDDDDAAIIMVETNLSQRTTLTYSEKAWAYRVELEALNHRGTKSSTPGELSVDALCEKTGESKTQIYNTIQLTELVPALIDKLDAGALKFTPALELSYLSRPNQTAVSDYLTQQQVRPSLSKAKRLREAAKGEKLTSDAIEAILTEPALIKVTTKTTLEHFSCYFPAAYTPEQMERVISGLLKNWQRSGKTAS